MAEEDNKDMSIDIKAAYVSRYWFISPILYEIYIRK